MPPKLRHSRRRHAAVAIAKVALLLAACAGPAPAIVPAEPGVVTHATPDGPSLTQRPTPSPLPTSVPTIAATPEPIAVFGAAPTGPTELATVVKVTDGDTINVSIEGSVYRLRYIGIDTPETVDPSEPVGCMGAEASARNAELVAGRQVILEKDVSQVDRFDRLLRYVWLQTDAGWLLVNHELVLAGYAQVSTYPPDVKYTDLFLAAESRARDAGVGLWGSVCVEPVTPVAPVPFVGSCDPAYPTVCIPPLPPDLDCGDITFRRFQVLPPDPHRFDGNGDGVGCGS